jgi:phosphatidylinositol N-acetylglucosaminyltransferase subunit C
MWSVCPWDGYRFKDDLQQVCKVCGSDREGSKYVGTVDVKILRSKRGRRRHLDRFLGDDDQLHDDDDDNSESDTNESQTTFSTSSSSSPSSSLSSSPSSSSSSSSTSNRKGKKRKREVARSPWRKNLFERQAYPDNYVDGTFLIGLRRNLHARQYDFATVAIESLTVSQQLALVCIFVAVFFFMTEGVLSTPLFLTIQSAMMALGYGVRYYLATTRRQSIEPVAQGLRSLMLLVATLAVIAPVLATLTDTTTDDTIWALGILLLLVHIFFLDYRYLNASSDKVAAAPLSLNAAIFASVLLASRLSSVLDVFAFVLFAVEVFALSPVLRHHVKRQSPNTGHIVASISLFGLATVALLSLSALASLCFVAIILFITFVCPFWLIWIQKYKQEINGPWDEKKLPASLGDQ